ncbi:MAG: glycosyltransferase [Nitriliruptor sp.]
MSAATRPQPTPVVTVVVPAFRRADRLTSCLEALAAQDVPRDHFDVVVVDDGSPQPLAPAALPFTEQLHVTVHRQANAGPAAARNAGAALARGALLAFTDDDCRPRPDWVRELTAAHHGEPEALLGGDVVNALDDPYAEASQLLVTFLYDWYADEDRGRFFASNDLAVPAAGFHALGGFDDSFPRPGGEDRELCERWARDGRPLRRVPTAIVDHEHRMDLRGFWRQQTNYGRGAHDLHRRRQAVGGGGLRPEGPRFYWRMVTAPFRTGRPDAWKLATLLVLSQVANVYGFASEIVRARRS